MSMLFQKWLKKTQHAPEKTNRHFLFLEAPVSIVGPLALHWNEGAWWPQTCDVEISKEGQDAMQVGTRYRQVLRGHKGKGWLVEVTQLVPGKLLERTFREGLFTGVEKIMLDERSNGTRVDYVLTYRVSGMLNQWLWNLFLEKKHDANIEMILKALKDYLLKHDLMNTHLPGAGQ